MKQNLLAKRRVWHASRFLKGDSGMQNYKIAVVAGDGIGPEVIAVFLLSSQISHGDASII